MYFFRNFPPLLFILKFNLIIHLLIKIIKYIYFLGNFHFLFTNLFFKTYFFAMYFLYPEIFKLLLLLDRYHYSQKILF